MEAKSNPILTFPLEVIRGRDRSRDEPLKKGEGIKLPYTSNDVSL
jgi:hypothetical protein